MVHRSACIAIEIRLTNAANFFTARRICTAMRSCGEVQLRHSRLSTTCGTMSLHIFRVPDLDHLDRPCTWPTPSSTCFMLRKRVMRTIMSTEAYQYYRKRSATINHLLGWISIPNRISDSGSHILPLMHVAFQYYYLNFAVLHLK